ncbi:hypothetical protein V6N13_044227 [Hibiscus sabdariffa]
MLVLWMRGYEVMFKAEGGCDPVNVGEGAVMVVNTQSMIALFNAEWRNQAVYIFGEGYMVMIFSFLLKGYGKTLFLPYVFVVFLVPYCILFFGQMVTTRFNEKVLFVAGDSMKDHMH